MTPVPLVLLVVSVPLAFGLVPRNRLYGLRMPFTMASDAAWYRANRIFAIATIAACALWLLLQFLIPLAFPSQPAAPRWADGLGWTAFGVAIALAIMKYRQPVA